jgi:hypothetical protein
MAPHTVPPSRTLDFLGSLRRTVRRLFLLEGLLALLFGIAGGIAVSFVIDYFLVLPLAVRGVFLLGAVVGLARAAHVHLVARLRRRLSDEEVASLVERTYPDLRQSLMTAVELSRPGSETAAYVSPALIRTVVEEVEGRVGRLRVDEVCSLRQLSARASLGVVAVAVLAAAVVADPVLSRIWLRRNVLLSAESWPQATELELVLPALPITVAAGDPLEIVVRAVRGSPEAVELRHGEPGSPDRLEVLASNASGSFRKAFENVWKPFRFTVAGGDDEIGPFDVDVKLRPRIDMQAISIWCDYPTYTRIPATPKEDPLRHGNLKVPTGTVVRYRMGANLPVRAVFFVFRPAGEGERPATSADPGGEAASEEADGPRATGGPGAAGSAEAAARAEADSPPWPHPLAVAVPVEGERFFSGEFTVSQNGQYCFQLESADGFRSVRPDSFRVEAVPDRNPLVRILLPESETERVSPEAAVRIRVSANDDYGIEGGAVDGLFFPGLGPQSEVRTIELPALASRGRETSSGPGPVGGVPRDGESREAETVLEIAALSGKPGEPPEPGSRLQYKARARDFAGNLGESQLHLLEIVAKEDLLRDLNDQLTIIRDQLREVQRRQVSARKDVAEIEGQLAAAGKLKGDDAQRLVRHQQDQLRISQALERQVGEFERILSRADQNRVGDEKWNGWVRGVRNDLNALALGKSKGVERSIETLRKEAQGEAQDLSRLSLVQASQRDVEREIESLVLRLSEFGDMNAVIQMLREVRRRQVELRDETRARATGETPDGEGGEE